jgi:hypothetical protein
MKAIKEYIYNELGMEFLDYEDIIENDRKALEEKELHEYIDFIMAI